MKVGHTLLKGCLALLFSGCTPELWESRFSGEISFTAYTNRTDTKTAYSGVRNNEVASVFFERIDWVAGDKIMLYCGQAQQPLDDNAQAIASYTPPAGSAAPGGTGRWPYLINPVAASGKYHSATLSAVQVTPGRKNSGLLWTQESDGKLSSDHHLFGVYPETVKLVDTQNPSGVGVMAIPTYLSQGVWFENAATIAKVGDTDNELVWSKVKQYQSVSALQPGKTTVRTTGARVSVDEYEPQMEDVTMAAYTKVAGGTDVTDRNTEVKLYFKPLVSALRVELKASETFPTTKKLTMLRLIKDSDAARSRQTELSLNKDAGAEDYRCFLFGHFFTLVGEYAGNNDPGDLFGESSALLSTPVIQVEEGTAYRSLLFPYDPSTTTDDDAFFAATKHNIHETGNFICIVPDGDAGMPETVFPYDGIKLSTTDPVAFTFLMTPYTHSGLYLELTFGGEYDPALRKVTGEGVQRAYLNLKNRDVPMFVMPRHKSYIDQITVAMSPENVIGLYQGEINWK